MLASLSDSPKEARRIYTEVGYGKYNTAQLQATIEAESDRNILFDKLNDIMSRVDYYRSIISSKLEEVNSLNDARGLYLASFGFDITELGNQWVNADELHKLHTLVTTNILEYFELTSKSSQYVQNYMRAVSQTTGRTADPFDDLVNILIKEMDNTPDNANSTYRLTLAEFESLADQYFYDSEQYRYKKAAKAINAFIGTEAPIDFNLFNK